ncbi:MAG: hypothetical protein AAF335_04695, partial [Bacteroidota bacterium]
LGPRGKTEISFRQFLRNSHLATLLVYKYHDTYEKEAPEQFISEKDSFAIRSAIEGILVAILAWTFLASTNINPFKSSDSPLNSGGLYNFSGGLINVCWYNSHFQMLMRCDPDILVNTKYKEVNQTHQNLIDKLKSAMNGGNGPTLDDVYCARDALTAAVRTHSYIPSRKSREQWDGPEFVKALLMINKKLYEDKDDLWPLELHKDKLRSLTFRKDIIFEGFKIGYDVTEKQKEAIEKYINKETTPSLEKTYLETIVSIPIELPVQDLRQNTQIEEPSYTMQELVDRKFSSEETIGTDHAEYLPVSALEKILKIENKKSWKKAKKELQELFKWKKKFKEEFIKEFKKIKKEKGINPKNWSDDEMFEYFIFLFVQEDKETKRVKELKKIFFDPDKFEGKEDSVCQPFIALYQNNKEKLNALYGNVKNNLEATGFKTKSVRIIEELLLQSKGAITMSNDEMSFKCKYSLQNNTLYNEKRDIVYLSLYQQVDIRKGKDLYYRKAFGNVTDLETITVPTTDGKTVRLRLLGASFFGPSKAKQQGNELIISVNSGHWVSIAKEGDKYLFFNDYRSPEEVDFTAKMNELRKNNFFPILLIYERVPEDEE